MLTFESIAQDLVDATSSLLCGRTVNIMNQEGIIVASSDKKRIGDFHQGAADVIAKGKTVRIYKEELKDYPGSKEGINMPMTDNEKIIGVVGVYGNPDEVEDTANLLRVYVELYFKQIAHTVKQEVEEEIRGDILKLLLSGEKIELSSVSKLSSVIMLDSNLPLTCIIIKPCNKKDKVARALSFKELQSCLVSSELMLSSKDVYGVLNESFVILKTFDENEEVESWLKQTLYFIESIFDKKYSVVLSGNCDSYAKLASSYNGALEINKNNVSGVYYLNSYEGMIRYFTQSYISKESLGEDFIQNIYNVLEKELGNKAFKEALRTLEVYYKNDRSVSKSADQLFIHKNTLLYRINKVYSVLGLESENDFIREYFLRLLLAYNDKIYNMNTKG
ncbi:CdaR family transcriptional regulator [Paratissierella segnis]|jgi:sugar diacid utilization regulator|uniref:Helix-turn-helix domain-containing protein n=1 Tax=Paratissierella segnis TaxID=2763679 RepID=A0A926IKB3_9FIRM|nr:sugar diacid recognition domain-containing protein [Paratissierella segnis]MBC8587533.1 helix-turn-helix domain-containing protein [Paratissierella segnis]